MNLKNESEVNAGPNFFISDLHQVNFGHVNIIDYCKRPFADTNEMDEALIGMLAELPANSTLWILGDVAMRGKDFAEQIAQRLAKLPIQIKIIGGNHDKGRTEIYHKYGLLEQANGRHLYEIEGHKVSMGHYPLENDEQAQSEILYLCGHIHDKWGHKAVNIFEHPSIVTNVGYDIWKKPVTLDEIITARRKWLDEEWPLVNVPVEV